MVAAECPSVAMIYYSPLMAQVSRRASDCEADADCDFSLITEPDEIRAGDFMGNLTYVEVVKRQKGDLENAENGKEIDKQSDKDKDHPANRLPQRRPHPWRRDGRRG